MKIVSDYTGLNFGEISELIYDIFLYFSREAVIYKLSQTDSGLEYLEKCWIMEQTKPDRKALREKFGE